MAKAIRIEGVAGGSGGVGGKTKGLTRAQIKKIQKAKPLTEPKSAVKVVPKSSRVVRVLKNSNATVDAVRAASGSAARSGAFGRNIQNDAERALGNFPKTVKIKNKPKTLSGAKVIRNTKPAVRRSNLNK